MRLRDTIPEKVSTIPRRRLEGDVLRTDLRHAERPLRKT
ncbi:MAG: hypothetical protein OJF50_006626 [Nitrospira sp.]|nr:hypothetical protein [Nitrospira sp.]